MDIEAAIRNEIGSYESKSWTGEIGGTSVTIYAAPLSASDVGKIQKVDPEFPLSGFSTVAMVEAISLKAADAEGKLIVTPVVKQLLKQMRSSTIGDIYFTLFADISESEEDSEARVGNSPTTT